MCRWLFKSATSSSLFARILSHLCAINMTILFLCLKHTKLINLVIMAPMKTFVLFSSLLCLKLCIAQVSSSSDTEEAVPPSTEPIIIGGISGSSTGGETDTDTGNRGGGFPIKGPPSPFCSHPGGGGCDCTCYTGFHSGCRLINPPPYSQCPFGVGNCWLISCPECPVCGVLPVAPSPLKVGKCHEDDDHDHVGNGHKGP